MTQSDAEAIVVGAGIGGRAAAIALRQAGMDVRVFERAEALEPVGAGLTLWANAIKALERLGVAAAVRALGVPELNGGIRTWRGEMLAPFSADDLRRRYGEASIAIHRADLQQVLLDALPTEVVRLGAACVELGQDERGVQARFADGSRVRGALLIGADGLRSIVRDHLLGAAPPRYAGYTAWRGVVAFDHGRTLPGETWGRGTRFGHVLLRQGHVYWFAAANAPAGAQATPAERKQKLLTLLQGWHEPIPELIAATDERAILHNDIYDRPPARRWGAGRMTLLGDAAHPMTPDLGQGACQALEDAVVLGECLRTGRTIDAALQRYAARRRPRTRMIARQSRIFGQVAQWENPLACQARDTLLRRLPANLQQQGLKRVVGDEFWRDGDGYLVSAFS